MRRIKKEKSEKPTSTVTSSVTSSINPKEEPVVINKTWSKARQLIDKKPEQTMSTRSYCTIYLIFFIISITSGFLIIYFGWDIKCADISTKIIMKNINERVYGQPRAIIDLENAFSSSNKVKIIILVGGTGQGKTYMSQIITEQGGEGHNVFKFLMKSAHDIKLIPNIQRVVLHCKYSLLIIDDLTLENISDSVYIIDKILNDIDLSSIKFDIILIFNTFEGTSLNAYKNTTESANAIHSQLQMLDLPIYLVQFEEMLNKYVEMCVQEAIVRSNLIDSKENINKVMEILEPNVGCKEVYAKVSLLSKSMKY